MTSTPDPLRHTRVEHHVRQLIHRLLVDDHSPTAVTTRPNRYSAMLQEPTDPVAGITAARTVAAHARHLMICWAKAARGEGLTWNDIAPALPLAHDHARHGDDDVCCEDLAVAAFRWVAPALARWTDTVDVVWECASCTQRVTDVGPYSDHPADAETGHAPYCARHTADIEAWRTRTGWDDDDDSAGEQVDHDPEDRDPTARVMTHNPTAAQADPPMVLVQDEAYAVLRDTADGQTPS